MFSPVLDSILKQFSEPAWLDWALAQDHQALEDALYEISDSAIKAGKMGEDTLFSCDSLIDAFAVIGIAYVLNLKAVAVQRLAEIEQQEARLRQDAKLNELAARVAEIIKKKGK